MKSKDLRNLICGVLFLFSSFAFADSWVQTDWSGEDGWYLWGDPTGYFDGSGVNGWRNPGFLSLFAPDFENFYSIGQLNGALGVYSLYADNLGRLFAGTGNVSTGSGRLFISTDFGNTWSYSFVDSNSVKKISAILLPSFDNEIFVGTEPSSKIYRSVNLGDSGWTYQGAVSGTYVSKILETQNQYLYSSSVHTSNNNAKIFSSTNYGLSWLLFDRQPLINSVTPAGISQFLIYNDKFFISTFYYNSGKDIAKIFRYDGNWELCIDLPDTICKPLAMGFGYDTLGNYGVLYVGVGEDTGKVFRSTDEGNTWDVCGFLEDAWSVNGLEVDRDGTVYAAVYVSKGVNFAVKVFRSTNMGDTWDTTSVLGATFTNKPTSFLQTEKGFLLVGTENEGEIFKSAYVDSGYLVSSVYDVGTGNGSSEFGLMTWQENLNGQNLDINVRTDSDSSMTNALPWNLCPFATNGYDISDLISVNDGDRYIQYRTELKSNSIDYSPELKEIEITYTLDTFPPCPDTAYATDGSNHQPGIDGDDSVTIVFDDSTNMPSIEPSTINTVLRLSGGHSWLDEDGFVTTQWLTPLKLKIYWGYSINGQPTVAVGDTIYPDTFTIMDRWGNPCYKPIVLTGSFDPPGVSDEGLTSESNEKVLVYPSISRNQLDIILMIQKGSDVKINIFDISGRLVHHVVEKRFSKGIHTIKWQNNKRIQSGIFFIKIDINNSPHIYKITIIK